MLSCVTSCCASTHYYWWHATQLHYAIFLQDSEGSYDFVSRDRDVMPGFSSGKQDRHGTSCAGEIAMVKDNGVCGVGVAYDSKISG